MAEIIVTASQLKAQAENLRQLNSNFKSAVAEMESMEESLNGMWDGTANDAFHAAFTSDKTQMNNFYNAIEVYIQRLEDIAAKYAQTEATNAEIATERRYQ